MNDLLKDSFGIPLREPSRDGDIEMGAQAATNPEYGFENFFKKVREIQKQIEKVNSLLWKLQIMDIVAEIQERHGAVKELEKKLLELQQIFLDMAVLVEAQGEMLDGIETEVSTAVDHLQTGNIALQKAKSQQESSLKWMCIAITIFLMIDAIIVVAVL